MKNLYLKVQQNFDAIMFLFMVFAMIAFFVHIGISCTKQKPVVPCVTCDAVPIEVTCVFVEKNSSYVECIFSNPNKFKVPGVCVNMWGISQADIIAYNLVPTDPGVEAFWAIDIFLCSGEEIPPYTSYTKKADIDLIKFYEVCLFSVESGEGQRATIDFCVYGITPTTNNGFPVDVHFSQKTKTVDKMMFSLPKEPKSKKNKTNTKPDDSL